MEKSALFMLGRLVAAAALLVVFPNITGQPRRAHVVSTPGYARTKNGFSPAVRFLLTGAQI